MCRNITELRGLEPPATHEEIEAAAVQFVREMPDWKPAMVSNTPTINRGTAALPCPAMSP